MDRPEDEENIISRIRVSNVIKNALQKARGIYAVVLNGDDYFCNDEKFSNAVTFLNSHEEYTAYVSGFKWISPDGRENILQAVKCPRIIFWAGMYIHISSFVFSKKVFDDGYFLSRLNDDTGLCFSILCAGKLKISEDITFVYKQREKSFMNTRGKLVLNIYELMLFQDCLNTGRMKWSTYSRFYSPLRQVYKQRNELSNEKYAKYIRNCEQYGNNILGEIIKSNTSFKSKIFVWYMFIRGKAATLFFKICKAPRKLRNILRKNLSR